MTLVKDPQWELCNPKIRIHRTGSDFVKLRDYNPCLKELQLDALHEGFRLPLWREAAAHPNERSGADFETASPQLE